MSNQIKNIIQGLKKQDQGRVQKKRGKLIGDDLQVLQGSTNTLLGKLQEVYGITEKEAAQQVRDYRL